VLGEPVTIAVDAMGGDRAPGEIVAGARLAAEQLGVRVLLVGRPDEIGDAGGLEVVPASEVITMDADPGRSVRRLKDSSLVRAAEAVRDGRADAMVSAGNTGATMASALFRMGRIKGVGRPAIATPIPSTSGGLPTILLDAGANAECQPEWLVQFAQMGAVFARARFGVDSPRVGLLTIGEEAGKGNSLVKETYSLLETLEWVGGTGAEFIGNVEGRDIMTGDVDVVVTDGFTGNVALKTLEGLFRAMVDAVNGVFGQIEEGRAAQEVVQPHLDALWEHLDPESTGGAMLLGVDGVCIISHGSSSALAMVNAVRVAADMVTGGVVGQLRTAIGR
jgi:glycerol-3-phosphate acyltransferase PlsX